MSEKQELPTIEEMLRSKIESLEERNDFLFNEVIRLERKLAKRQENAEGAYSNKKPEPKVTKDRVLPPPPISK